MHVPLPRSGQGLVEVVEIEEELPRRRGEYTQVAQVRVAGELHVQSSDGQGR